MLKLPPPWLPATEPTPLIIYGGATAVGAFTIQLAKRSNIHPLIVVAGKSIDWVRGMLDESRGDAAVDYRGKGRDEIAAAIRAAARGAPPLRLGYDAVSEHGSAQTLARALEPEGSMLTTVASVKTAAGDEQKSPVPLRDDEEALPASIGYVLTMCGVVFGGSAMHGMGLDTKGASDFAHVFFRLFSKGLAEGWLEPHPYRAAPGGLAGVEAALRELRDGNVSAFKWVFRVPEAEDAGRDNF